MHLLVLSAFRLGYTFPKPFTTVRLNAPSGAQCFPTPPTGCFGFRSSHRLNAPSGAQCFPTAMLGLGLAGLLGSLNAPSGAQCFPTEPVQRGDRRLQVSMHLLVLSAFRRKADILIPGPAVRSQCTFWCSVLSDP